MSGNPLDWGRPIRSVRFGWGSIRLDLRLVATCLVAMLLTALLLALSLALGDYPIYPDQLWTILTGQGEGLARTVVLDWRLPRALMALICGAGLGVAGGIFQSITRNPLGSPDVIGLSAGSYTGALIVIILWTSSYGAVTTGALTGGLLSAAAIYFLAYRGGILGFRLIVVGIAISAMLSSVNMALLLRSDSEIALSAAVWGAGSLNGVGWDHATPAAVIICLLLAAVAFFARDMHGIELGDDAAKALGVPVERSRFLLIGLGVALTAAITAVAGPIAFIALAAPQIALRLSKSQGIALFPAGCVGALLLLAADLLSQRLFAPRQWPVGIMTVSIGGLYLLWLLMQQARKRS